MLSVYIGCDPREDAAFAVARESLRFYLSPRSIPIKGLVLSELQRSGLYTRPTERRLGRLYDVISKHEMSTEFAISRFLVPHLAKKGWAIFADCDMMFRKCPTSMMMGLDPKYALYCVQHEEYVPRGVAKMDGQIQSPYARKNWSSFMVFNCDHPSNQALSVGLINSIPGRDLHRFCWLKDEEIGALPAGWNWLVGEQPEPAELFNVHYTRGGPWLEAFRNAPYADDWWAWRARWAKAAA
jgi:hypothetical protein